MILRILCCAILQFCIIGYVFGVVPQITRLNVQCDRTGMKVNVEFDNPFNGIIFSKGHYSDPNCRWVSASSTRRQFNFYIGTSKCGSIGTDMATGSSSPQGFKNVIIIQNDPDYQEVWDSARKLSCDWVTRLEKYVTFAPFGVDMLGVKELRFPGDTVDCWMDIQRGHGPFAPSVGGVVPIGEKLTVVIYVRDTDSSFDVHVKDCYAYDSSNYRSPDARAIKLTDERGCPVKEKLVQGFYRTRDVRSSGATIIAYGIINAFKFPERMDVFLACNVEVCKGACPNNDCQPEVAVAGTGDVPAIGDGSTTAAPSTGGDEEVGGEEEKPAGGEDTSSTTEATETDEGEKTTEDSADSGSGTATEEAESSEDTSEKPKDEEAKEEDTKEEETKDEESKGEESKDESKDEESKDEETKDEETKEEDKKEEGESKDEEKTESNDVEEEKSTDTEEKKDEEKSEDASGENTDDSESEKETKEEPKEETKEEEKKDEEGDKEQTKESKDDDEEDSRKAKAARLRLPKKSGRKSKSKKADVITPRKRSAKRPARKGPSQTSTAKPKAAKLKKVDKDIKPKVKKSKISKAKPKSSSLKTAPNKPRPNKEKSAKVRARIIRAPSSIPAAFSRQHRELNMAFDEMYQRQGRHIRSRRSVTVLSENATFPAMMHSISIISPIEDLDEKELAAWEKMMDLEGKAEEVSLFEAITKLPTVNSEGGYCFTMTSLASASVLLAAIVMVLSMSVAMVCMHLHGRSSVASAKVVDMY